MAARFREIADDLRSAIERGEYRPGDRLPRERDLAERYGVVRETMSRALGVLKAEGLLVSHTSRGTEVALPALQLHIARYGTVADPDREHADLGPWETTCKLAGIDGRTEVTAVERKPADDQLAKRLEVDPGADLIHRTRRMWAGDRIAQVQNAWMPATLVEGTPLAGNAKVIGGVYAAMTAAGFPPTRFTEEVRSRPATSDEHAAMDLGDSATVLEIWRTTREQAGRVLEVLLTVADARHSTFVYDNLPIERSEA